MIRHLTKSMKERRVRFDRRNEEGKRKGKPTKVENCVDVESEKIERVQGR